MNNSLRNTLIALKFVLENKILKSEQLVTWVDFIIVEENITDPILLDLSVCKSDPEMLSILNDYALDFELNSGAAVFYYFLFQSHKHEELSSLNLARILYELSLDDIEGAEGLAAKTMDYWDALDIPHLLGLEDRKAIEIEMLNTVKDNMTVPFGLKGLPYD